MRPRLFAGNRQRLWRPDADEEPHGSHATVERNDEGEEVDELDKLLDAYSNIAQAQVAAVQQNTAKGTSRKMEAIREEGLKKPISSDNRGFQLLQKMGFQEGQGLGSSVRGRTEPIPLDMRAARSGLGVHEERKRVREEREVQQAAEAEKRVRRQQQQQARYQQAAASSFSSRRVRGQLAAARSAAETLDEQAGTEASSVLRQLPDPAAKAADGQEHDGGEEEEEEQEEEMPPEQQLEMLLQYLRGEHQYCVYCGCKYAGPEDLGEHCPGVHEEDH